jgi:hypothetical protein
MMVKFPPQVPFPVSREKVPEFKADATFLLLPLSVAREIYPDVPSSKISP